MRLVHRRRSWFDPKPEREKLSFPLTVTPYRTYEPVMPGESQAAARKDPTFNPYPNGDLMFFNDGTESAPDIKLARVLHCFWELLERRDYYIPKWRVQIATKDGHWSGTWKYIYPGQVFRAYHDGDDLRDMPIVVASLAECRPVPVLKKKVA